MSINMSNVKSITLGGQNVKKIADKNGNVLWQDKISSATISLTVGAGQDCASTQYLNAIRIPSSGTIKDAISNKTGIPYDDINVKKVELDLSTLYWLTDSSKKHYPTLSTSSSVSSSTVYFGAGETRQKDYVFQWDTYKLDVTKYMNTRLFGYRYNYDYDYWNPKYSSFAESNSSGPKFCQSYGTSLPIFTIVVTY